VVPAQSRKSPSAWNERPDGCVSVGKAATHLNVSPQRVRQLIRDGKLQCRRVRASRDGSRDRVWVDLSSVLERVSAQTSTASDKRANESSDENSQLQSVLRERDEWRAQALWARGSLVQLSLAFDAMDDALQHKVAAEEHASAQRVEDMRAFDSLRRAIAHQTEALRQFGLPVDPGEF
jgi:hypothetical protein